MRSTCSSTGGYPTAGGVRAPTGGAPRVIVRAMPWRGRARSRATCSRPRRSRSSLPQVAEQALDHDGDAVVVVRCGELVGGSLRLVVRVRDGHAVTRPRKEWDVVGHVAERDDLVGRDAVLGRDL